MLTNRGKISLFFEKDKAVNYPSLSYFRQGSYVFIGVCLFVCLFVCLLAGLRNNYAIDLHKIQWKRATWVTEVTISFWW